MKIVKEIMKYIDMLMRQAFRFMRKGSKWFKLLIVLMIILYLVKQYNSSQSHQVTEGFINQEEKFVVKKEDEVYDDFYVSIYDDLTYDKIKNNYEVGEIAKLVRTSPKKSVILDIGSGTGHHCKLLSDTYGTKQVYGLDKSAKMVAYAKELNPELNFKVGDALVAMTYPQDSFSLITCLYFTIYNIQDKATFFQNCYGWLKPGGYLAVHLVNRDMFDPILNVADPLQMVSAQKFAKERITNSFVKFHDFQYKADFKLNKSTDKAVFEETMTDDETKNVRKNEHVLYMPTQKKILQIAKNAGFILKGHVDMVTCQYEYQYIYLLYKSA